jgi:hypothetical protein
LQKGRASGKLMDFAGDESFWNSIFFLMTTFWKFEKLKSCIERGLSYSCIGGDFSKVCVNSSNLIYIVIIFPKLKIY